MNLGCRTVGIGGPYIIAEMSCNHAGDFTKALRLIRAAKAAGADAIKFQHYTPETMGNQDRPITEGPWAGQTQGALYAEAAMPWAWTPDLIAECARVGIAWLSTPYDRTALAYLEQFQPMAYKVASFELTDLDFIAAVAATGRPMLLSTGMATWEEVSRAMSVARETEVLVLHCISAYPCPPEAANLARIIGLQGWFGDVGFSDHTVGFGTGCAAAAYGAVLIEKHLKLYDAEYDHPTADAAFSLNPTDFTAYVAALRDAAKAVIVKTKDGDVEAPSRQFRRASGGPRGSYA